MVSYARIIGLKHAYIDFKGCPSADEFFEGLNLDLGQSILRIAHSASGPGRMYRVIEDLQSLSKPLVLVFDTYEKGPLDLQRWVAQLMFPRLEPCPIVAVVGGQEVPEHANTAWEGLAVARDLEPIDRVEDWLEYTQRRWPSSQTLREHVYAFTVACKGNPGQLAALLATFAQAQARTAGGGQP